MSIQNSRANYLKFFGGNKPVQDKSKVVTWEKTFGGDASDVAHSIFQTNDGGFIVAGETNGKGAGKEDFLIIKLNKDGVTEWEKTLGSEKHDIATSIIQTKDGGYIVTGNTKKMSGRKSDIWLMKLDENGEMLWEKTLGGSKDDFASSIVETQDGGLALVGDTRSKGDKSKIWFLKMSAKGQIEWEKVIGGRIDEFALSLVHTTDGGYGIAGYAYLGTKKMGHHNFWIIKLTAQGKIVWERTYGGMEDDFAYALTQTEDNGFVVAGSSISKNQEQYRVLKIDQNGQKVWDKTFGGNDDDFAFSVANSSDGGVLIAGYTKSKGEGDSDIWILKLDKEGTLIWDRTFGGQGEDMALSITETEDRGMAIAGTTRSKGNGESDIWVIKLNEQGAYTKM